MGRGSAARWRLVGAAALVALVATLATLQYRWLGDVSAAERERLRAGLHERAADCTAAFDREIARVFDAFHVDRRALDEDAAGALSAATREAARTPAGAALVKAVYLFDGASGSGGSLRRLDAVHGALEPSPWPETLQAWRHLPAKMPSIARTPDADIPVIVTDTIDPDAPALIVGVPRLVHFEPGRPAPRIPGPDALARAVIVLLDRTALRDRLLAPIVEARFGSGDAAEYVAAVVRRSHPADVIYAAPRGERVDAERADLAMPFFSLRGEDARVEALADAPSEARRERLSITIVRRGEGGGPVRLVSRGDEGAWTLLVRGKAGSLDALVARSRRRNLGISLGVLGLLAASVALIIGSAQRQRRLARQQMEFVAAVTHELRTPLAVIRSAGENLADGVVSDGAQVRQYGALVEAEGRRLTDMVERVMEYAGMSAGGSRRVSVPVDIGGVVAEAAGGVAADARRCGVDVRVDAGPGALPPVTGDPEALRSAVQNVIANAVKYSQPGSQVEIGAAAGGRGVRVRVADRGIGIDPDELPHIFEPFFRGRRAVDAQVRGTGVGLSVVRGVVDAHGGDVFVESTAGRGTTVVIELPLSAAGSGAP
ncbi:MAG TPA: HAMP domain-containing sensor histidine kinase [Vicinamibacterales bacterium]|nr:HAMP domain-containing sensor histidine kinase [Vicinamibacterales bacterium]